MTADMALRRRQALVLVLCLAIVAAAGVTARDVAVSGARDKIDPGLLADAARHPSSMLSVIVRERRVSSTDAEDFVRELGGHVTLQHPIVGGFAAELPGSEVTSLARSGAVVGLWENASIHVNSVDMSAYDHAEVNYVWQDAIHLPQARSYQGGSYLGSGTTVALIDTGVSQVADLGNRVLARVDFTS